MADSEVAALTEQTTPALTDLLYLTDSGGTIDRKVQVGTLRWTGAFVGAKAYHSTTQSINTGTWTAVLFDTEDFDTDAIHSTASNTSRFTVPSGKAGKWMFTSSLFFAANSTGVRGADFWKNGSSAGREYVQVQSTSASSMAILTQAVFNLAVADYIEIAAFQNSGGSLNLNAGSTVLSAVYLGA